MKKILLFLISTLLLTSCVSIKQIDYTNNSTVLDKSNQELYLKLLNDINIKYVYLEDIPEFDNYLQHLNTLSEISYTYIKDSEELTEESIEVEIDLQKKIIKALKDLFLFAADKEGNEIEDYTFDGNAKCIKDDEETTVSNLIYLNNSPFNNNILKPDYIRYNDKEYYVIKYEKNDIVGYQTIKTQFPGGTLEIKPGETIASALDKIISVFSDYEYFYDIYGRFVFQQKKTNDISYTFNNSVLVFSYSNTPDISNLKNDFTVWGSYESAAGAKIDTHLRYAIDKKPISYKRTDGENKNFTTESGYDWREIIYQMADDYYLNNQKGHSFYSILAQLNPEYKTGATGYEQYYSDILGFWRDVYNEDGTWVENLSFDKLRFWLEFIEGSSELQPYSVKNIGVRPKVLNSNNASIISNEDIMPIVYLPLNEDMPDGLVGKYIEIKLTKEDNFDDCFAVAQVKKTLQDEMNILLSNHLQVTQSVSLSTLGLYFLEPNTKIKIIDNINNIVDNVIIDKISFSFSGDCQMTISAIKEKKKII